MNRSQLITELIAIMENMEQIHQRLTASGKNSFDIKTLGIQIKSLRDTVAELLSHGEPLRT